MGYQREREDFILAMVAEGMPAETARLIMRYASTIQRLAVTECNRSLTPAEEKLDTRCMARISELIFALRGGEDAKGNNWRVKYSGDPRGACVKIKVPSGRTTDFGGEGICVPTRRF